MQSQDTPIIAAYARVSSDEQVERGSIENQLDFFHKWGDLHGVTIVQTYTDDGVSGAVPLSERPAGRRMLADAKAGRFNVVLVYRLDRLARSLRVLLDTHETFDRFSVAVKSGTEPLDTTTAVGRLFFQLLGSFAEFERSSISERMVSGRDRNARYGRFVSGRVPYGYTRDASGYLAPSIMEATPMTGTVADVVRGIYHAVARGGTADAEAQRLNAFGVLSPNAHLAMLRGKPPGTGGTVWYPAQVAAIIKNPTYRGDAVLRSRHGEIPMSVPPLVDAQTWTQARAQLTRNKKLPTRRDARAHLLRGLITCDNCGYRYTGANINGGPRQARSSYLAYRCSGAQGSTQPIKEKRCHARLIPGEWLESAIWDECAQFIRNPGDYLAEAQRQLRDRTVEFNDIGERLPALRAAIATKQVERERVLALARRGHVTMAEAEKELDTIAHEVAALQGEHEALTAHYQLLDASERHLSDTADAIQLLRNEVESIEAMEAGAEQNARKRPIIERLVLNVRARTSVEDGRKRLTLTIRYAHQPTVVRCVGNGTEHDIHHRSQLDTYAGLNGWDVPDIYNRSAETIAALQAAEREKHAG